MDNQRLIRTETKKVIYKYPLKGSVFQTLQLPLSANILTIQEQNNELQLWAEVDYQSSESTRERQIELFYTGEPFETDLNIIRRYISTIQLSSGIVIHVFERYK